MDFRQERRWKIATAHRLAKEVLQWHQADPLGKLCLQVKVLSHEKKPSAIGSSDPTITMSLAPPHQITSSSASRSIQPTSEATHGELASPSFSTKGSPESFRSIHPLRSPISVETTTIPHVEKQTAAITPEDSHASAQESRKTMQQIKRSRIPIFEMAPDETLIDIKKFVLDGIRPEPTGYTVEHVKLQKLFADLPLFGDLDSRPDKRPDEASPHLGRIARIAPFLDAKPLLVSTLQPSKNCLGKQWRNLGPLSADDLRDTGDPKSDSSHQHNHIFSGRKSKEVKEPIIPAPPASPAPDAARTNELTWGTSDEELLKQIASTYEFNWKIIADVFNASISNPLKFRVSPRDCYDCWKRLHQSTKPATHHTSTPPSKSTSEANSVAAANPAPTIQSDTQVPSVESNESKLPDGTLPANGVKRPAEASLFPNKRTKRDDALQDIARKVKEKRASEPQKPGEWTHLPLSFTRINIPFVQHHLPINHAKSI